MLSEDPAVPPRPGLFDLSFADTRPGLPDCEYKLGEYSGLVNDSFVQAGVLGTLSMFG